MTEPTINSLLKEAESAALSGDWQNSIRALQQVLEKDPHHAAANFTLGTLLMETGSPAEAIPCLKKCIGTAPDHEEASVNLAKALAQNNQVFEAETILKSITEQNPENRSAWNTLAQILILQDDRVSEAVQILAALVQSDTSDADALYLMGKVYESVDDINSALEMYNQILRHHPEDQRALTALSALGISVNSSGLPSVCFIGLPTISTENRLGIPARELAGLGHPVSVQTSWDKDLTGGFDTFIFSEPHAKPEFLEAFLECKAAGKKVYIDLDLHYPSLTSDHPRYEQSGRGNPEGIEALEHILDASDGILVSNQALAEEYQKPGRETRVFPPVWDENNELWKKQPEPRDQIHLGLIGSQLHENSAALLKPALVSLFEKFENLTLVILSNYTLLDVFHEIGEHRSLFLPAGRYEDYPYQLSQIDILLVPGEEERILHKTRSDRPLLEAGIRKIPWAAAACPSFKEWNEGGVLIHDPSEWETVLEDLITNPENRAAFGEAGGRKAQSRTAGKLIFRWQELLQNEV